jgi:hypothetical protein
MQKSEIINLLTINLYRESETPALGSDLERHSEKIICKDCPQAYTLDYERRSLSVSEVPEILKGMLDIAQRAVKMAHFSTPPHQDHRLEVAITFHRL